MQPKNISVPDALLLAIAAATITASQNSPTFDIGQGQTFSNYPFDTGPGIPMSVTIPVTSFFSDGTASLYSFTVQDSPDGTTWTARSTVRSVGASAASPTDSGILAASGGILTVPFTALQRFLRVAVTVAGSTPTIVLQNCYFNPFVNPLA
jgi:hypothetical protein